MYHLYIHTPLYNNSNYLPHLIEHIIVTNIKKNLGFFGVQIYKGSTYTYYTEYIIESENENDLNYFINNLTKDIDLKYLSYEKKVLKNELSGNRYIQKLIRKIGKQYYDKDIKYGVSSIIKKNELISYYNNYYKNGKIVVLEKDLKTIDNVDDKINIITSFSLKNLGTKEHIIIGTYDIANLYTFTFIGELFNMYIEYCDRYINSNYYYNDTIVGEYTDIVFLSIEYKYLNIIKYIDENFITDFIIYKIKNFKNDDYCDIDGPVLLKFGHTLSSNSKISLLKNIKNNYINFINYF